MPVKGATITYNEITDLLAKIPSGDLKETQLFLEGDHWQENAGWIGWKPETGSATAVEDWTIIQTGFTPKNVIKGMVWRLRGAVLGKEPDWEVVTVEDRTPDPDPLKEASREKTPEEKKWKDIDNQLTLWWAEKRVLNVLKDFATNYASYGKASLQIYVPKGYVKPNSDGTVSLNVKQGADIAEVLSKIYVTAPSYEVVNDATDLAFGEDYVCIQIAKESDNDPTIYEVHYVDEDKKTHLRQVTENAGSKDITLDLGGNLLTYVIGKFENAMISKPVKQQQKQLNHAKTMEGYALANINFPETVFLNADLPSEKKKGPDGSVVTTVKPLWRGAGRFLSLVGIATMNTDGSESITSPDIRYKTPADPEKFAKVAENNTRDMHQEAGMLYILLSSSPYPSGDARVESMTDYLILLVDYKTMVDTAGMWLLSTVLRLVFNFTNRTDENDKFRVLFNSKITIGRMSVEDRRLMLDEVAAELRSRRNYIVTSEISDDPNSELAAIANEPKPQKPVDPNVDPNKPKPAPATK